MTKSVIVIEDENCEVFAFQDTPELITVVAINPFLILLDDRLAHGYGSDFCSSIKIDDRTSHIPVILVSASPNLETVAKNCQADGIIPKPFELEKLIETVVKFLPSGINTYRP